MIYLKHQNGSIHALSGRAFKKLRTEILAGRGGPEVTALVLSGYYGFLSKSGDVFDFEALTPEEMN
jgi:hypothetical protein